MRNANEIPLDTGIYARLREVRMSGADRHNAINALRQAEQFVDAIRWLKGKLADIGHIFLKPSLKH